MLGDLGLAGGDHQWVVPHSGDLAGEQSVNIVNERTVQYMPWWDIPTLRCLPVSPFLFICFDSIQCYCFDEDVNHEKTVSLLPSNHPQRAPSTGNSCHHTGPPVPTLVSTDC